MRRAAKPVTVRVEQLRFSARLFGPVRVVTPALRSLNVPWQWDSPRGAFLLPLQRLDDVAAHLELAGHHVDLEMPRW